MLLSFEFQGNSWTPSHHASNFPPGDVKLRVWVVFCRHQTCGLYYPPGFGVSRVASGQTVALQYYGSLVLIWERSPNKHDEVASYIRDWGHWVLKYCPLTKSPLSRHGITVSMIYLLWSATVPPCIMSWRSSYLMVMLVFISERRNSWSDADNKPPFHVHAHHQTEQTCSIWLSVFRTT